MKKLGHYNLIQTDAGWHSTLCAGNNKVILTSTSIYGNKVLSETQTITLNALLVESAYIDKRISSDGKHYFCVVFMWYDIDSGEVAHDDIYKSETYNTKQSMERGIKSVLANAKTTDVRIVDRRTKK